MSKKTEDTQEILIPFSAVVRTKNWLVFKGEVGLGGDGELITGGIFKELEAIVEHMRRMLWSEGKFGLDSIVNATIYVKNMGDAAAMKAEYARIMPKPKRLPRIVMAEELSYEGAHVEVEAAAYIRPDHEYYDP